MLSFECVDVVVWLCPPLGAELRLQESFLCKPEVKLESLSLVHFRVLFLLRLVPQILLGFFFPFLCFAASFQPLSLEVWNWKFSQGFLFFLMKLCCLVSLFFLVFNKAHKVRTVSVYNARWLYSTLCTVMALYMKFLFAFSFLLLKWLSPTHLQHVLTTFVIMACDHDEKFS